MDNFVCTKDYKSFKAGEIYHSSRGKFYLDGEVFYLNHDAIDKYFKFLRPWLQVPYISTRTFLGIKISNKKKYKIYRFRCDDDLLFEIYQKIHAPIFLMTDEDILLQCSNDLHYVLGALETLIRLDSGVDISSEIDRAGEYLQEVKKFYDSIDSKANENVELQIAGFVEGHHEVMKGAIARLKHITELK